jgi:hypothetical protein
MANNGGAVTSPRLNSQQDQINQNIGFIPNQRSSPTPHYMGPQFHSPI